MIAHHHMTRRGAHHGQHLPLDRLRRRDRDVSINIAHRHRNPLSKVRPLRRLRRQRACTSAEAPSDATSLSEAKFAKRRSRAAK